MTHLLLILFATLALGTGSASARETPALQLRDEVVVRDAHLRLMDLSAGPMDADLGRVVLCAAPAPGHERTFDRDDLMREMVRAGVRPVPRLAGATRVVVRRPGQTIAPDALAERVLEALERTPAPIGALDHRFELLSVPAISVSDGAWKVDLDGDLPRIGRGSVAVNVRTAAGDERRVFVSLRREARVAVLRTQGDVDGASPIDLAGAAIDTLWTDDRSVLDERVPVAEHDGRWSLRRHVRGGHVLLQRDVRATPVVHRGELVEWVVERAGLRIAVSARSRGEGAVGEWILVESPFDGRLRRVVVVGPARVADHLPAVVPATADLARGGTP